MATQGNTDPLSSPIESNTSRKSEDLYSVTASESELVEDDSKSQNFGKSLMDQEELNHMIKKRIFERHDVRLPKDDVILKPKKDECVVFKDQFTVGLRFPVQELVKNILGAYNIELHHLTPNGICKIALFIWAVKCQIVEPDVVAFCSLHEMHTQFKHVDIHGKKVTKYFGCSSFKPVRGG